MYELLTHDLNSKSGTKLANALNCRQVLAASNPNILLINWGVWGVRNPLPIINERKAVETCCSKMGSYRAFKEHGIKKPEWTTSYTIASNWSRQGYKVYTRSDDQGCQGRGIIVTEPGLRLPEGLFYT